MEIPRLYFGKVKSLLPCEIMAIVATGAQRGILEIVCTCMAYSKYSGPGTIALTMPVFFLLQVENDNVDRPEQL